MSKNSISILGLALSLSIVVSGCGPGMQSKKSARATSGQRTSVTQGKPSINPNDKQNKTLEELAQQNQEKQSQVGGEEPQVTGSSPTSVNSPATAPSDKTVDTDVAVSGAKSAAPAKPASGEVTVTNPVIASKPSEVSPAAAKADEVASIVPEIDPEEATDFANADLFISAAKLAIEGKDTKQELVFSLLLKESSKDEKAQLELRAKVAGAEVKDMSLLNKANPTEKMDEKLKEYKVTSKCVNSDCSLFIIRTERKNKDVAYVAELTYELLKDQKVATLKSSTLKLNDKIPSLDQALASVAPAAPPKEAPSKEAQSKEEKSDDIVVTSSMTGAQARDKFYKEVEEKRQKSKQLKTQVSDLEKQIVDQNKKVKSASDALAAAKKPVAGKPADAKKVKAAQDTLAREQKTLNDKKNALTKAKADLKKLSDELVDLEKQEKELKEKFK